MAPIESYEQAEAWLLGRVNYEKTQPGRQDFKLDRMRLLLHELGNPQERIPAIHIAGTKGKGSTSAMCDSILRAAGHRVGLYTSPHLFRFEERMTVDGELMSGDEVIRLVNSLRDVVTRLEQRSEWLSPTFFEAVTALAWMHFLERQVRAVVLEVGLGGRLDATNVCRPMLTVITSISRDHTAILGSSIASIAGEKAGIAKDGIPMISGATVPDARAVIRSVCDERKAPLWELETDLHVHPRASNPASGDRRSGPVERQFDVVTPHGVHNGLTVGLTGAHQLRNAALAVAVCDRLREQGWEIPETAIVSGLRQVRWPLRVEIVQSNPTLLLDAAHNWASVRALLATLDADFPRGPRTLLFAGTRDKDVSGMLRQLLPRFDRVILTQYLGNPRAFPVSALHRLVRSLCDRPVLFAPTPAEGLAMARVLAAPDELICATGSFFLAAELRALVASESRAPSGDAVAAEPIQST